MTTAAKKPTPVTVIVPLFNEEEGIPQLADALLRLRKALAGKNAMQLILVDDGSTDATAQVLMETFSSWKACDIVQHSRNQGIAAAIQTGLKNARTEIVCSIDADCTYDPLELMNMLPLLTDGVDLVTASPYHPAGAVKNVPAWRLTLSKGAAFLYRQVLRSPLHTFTSCCRVYRRSAVSDLNVRHPGFQGVAELLAQVIRRGGRVVEHPAVLDVRRYGQSKMRVLSTIGGHLELLAQLLLSRLTSSTTAAGTAAGSALSPPRSGPLTSPHLERTTA